MLGQRVGASLNGKYGHVGRVFRVCWTGERGHVGKGNEGMFKR